MNEGETSVGVVQGPEETQKLEVVCRITGPGEPEVELRLLAWGEGVGWYRQRTLPLPADLSALLCLLRRAKRLRGASRPPAVTRARVVAFPVAGRLATARPA
jgi:hypothetical protein